MKIIRQPEDKSIIPQEAAESMMSYAELQAQLAECMSKK